MGIQGLLQGLKFATKHGSIREFEGQAVCVDGSSWLHKSVYSIAEHYVENIERNSLDRRSIAAASSYIIKRCDELLQYAHIRQIYFVMDGKRCPLKSGTNADRDNRRQENLKEARRLKQLGDNEGAFERYKACIKVTADLTKEVARALSQRFRKDKVTLVWAPYEADPQLVKLCMDKHCSAIITEDSDVLVYSAAARAIIPIIFKLDRKGQCQVISMAWLLCPETNLARKALPVPAADDKKKKVAGIESMLEAFALRESREPGLGARLFVQACVLTGCDYVVNELEGVGLVNAFKAIRNGIHRTSDNRFRHVLSLLPSKASKSIDKIEYEELLAKSEAVFYHHPVVECSGKIVYLLDATTYGPQFPSMERFQADTSFIGDIAHAQGPSNHPLQDKTNVAPPVSEIAVTCKNKRKSDNSYDEGLKKTKEIVPLFNPYQQTKKRKQDKKPPPEASTTVKSSNLQSEQKGMSAFLAQAKETKKDCEINKYRNTSRDIRLVKSAQNAPGLKSFKFRDQATAPTQQADSRHDEQSQTTTSARYEHNLHQPLHSHNIDQAAMSHVHSLNDQLDSNDILSRHASRTRHDAEVDPAEQGLPMSHYAVDQDHHNPHMQLDTTAQSAAAHDGQSMFYDLCESDESVQLPVQDENASLMRSGSLERNPSGQFFYPTDSVSSTQLPLGGARDDEDCAMTLTSRQQHSSEVAGRRSKYFAKQSWQSSDTVDLTSVDDRTSGKGLFQFASKAQCQSQSAGIFSSYAHSYSRRVTNDLSPGLEESVAQPTVSSPLGLASSPQRKQQFEYDEWLASPSIVDQVMTTEELQADDILSSPEPCDNRRSFGLLHRKPNNTVPPKPKSTIGPAKTMRNRFASLAAFSSKPSAGLIGKRVKKGDGLIQGKLPGFFKRG